MQTPSPLSFAPVLMKDAEFAESNKKTIFRLFQFYFSSYRENSSKMKVFWAQKWLITWKNKDCKFDFLFVSAHPTCFMDSVQTKDIQIPRPQLSSYFQERCGICWNEWKVNLSINIFWVIMKIHRKLTFFRTKMTITRKI